VTSVAAISCASVIAVAVVLAYTGWHRTRTAGKGEALELAEPLAEPLVEEGKLEQVEELE
jgi:hypothetical protein